MAALTLLSAVLDAQHPRYSHFVAALYQGNGTAVGEDVLAGAQALCPELIARPRLPCKGHPRQDWFADLCTMCIMRNACWQSLEIHRSLQQVEDLH